MALTRAAVPRGPELKVALEPTTSDYSVRNHPARPIAGQLRGTCGADARRLPTSEPRSLA